MSRRIVGYEGEGKHRRPIYEDLGPARAGDVSGLAAAGRLSALDIRGTDRPEGAGPVERRQITAAEVEARRDDRPALNSPEHRQQSRLNGGARTSAIHARIRALVAPEEEPVMAIEPSQPAQEPTTPLEALADAAARADAARRAKEAADEAWRVASGQLEAAMAEVNAILAASTNGHTDMPDFMHPAPAELRTVAPKPPAARPAAKKAGGDAQRAEDAAERGRMVLEALERHGGDTRKAGLELGLRGNVVGRLAQAARARQAAAAASSVPA